MSSYTQSISIPSFSPITVYAQFNPTAGIAYSGNINITGGGLVCTVNVAVTGYGLTPCSGTPTAGRLSAVFAYIWRGKYSIYIDCIGIYDCDGYHLPVAIIAYRHRVMD